MMLRFAAAKFKKENRIKDTRTKIMVVSGEMLGSIVRHVVLVKERCLKVAFHLRLHSRCNREDKFVFTAGVTRRTNSSSQQM